MTAPRPQHLSAAIAEALQSPCRSRRGMVLFEPRNGRIGGVGFNGPPGDGRCPGRAICAGTCGQRAVHAEVRALRDAAYQREAGSGILTLQDLLQVELAADDSVVACDGPSCWQCSREILDVGFVGGVWLYEETRCKFCDACDRLDLGGIHLVGNGPAVSTCLRIAPHWRRYTAADFHRVTLERCGIRT